MNSAIEATIEDLYRLPDNAKAEILNGELVLISPTGDAPGYAADEIFVSLPNAINLISISASHASSGARLSPQSGSRHDD